MKVSLSHILLAVCAALLIVAAVTAGAQSAVLLAPKDRKPALDFVLPDSFGSIAQLRDYQGKVVAINFWATTCTGCEQEMPWFSEFQTTYAPKGFAVLGISLDDVDYAPGTPHGWDAIRPFLAQNALSYRMLLADAGIVQKYGLRGLPDTLLIDRHGRVAAGYVGIVKKADVEAKIRTLLSEP